MDRKYYICNDLDELEHTQEDLLNNGFNNDQLHVLGADDSAVINHHMNEVNCFSKTDLFNGVLRGALLGVLVFPIAFVMPDMFGVSEEFGWLPSVFLALSAFFVVTWEGGLLGIQRINSHFRNFESALDHGEYVMIVDYKTTQQMALQQVFNHHPMLRSM